MKPILPDVRGESPHVPEKTRDPQSPAESDLAQWSHDYVAGEANEDAYQARVAARPLFVATEAQYEQSRWSGRDDTADSVVEEERLAMVGRTPETEHDRAVWRFEPDGSCRIVAVIRAGADGVPLVTRFDAEGQL